MKAISCWIRLSLNRSTLFDCSLPTFCLRHCSEHELLKAALSDWVDFWYVPTPRVFMIYADHDEYSTFFADTKSSLNRVALPLLEARFKEVRDYQRDSTN